MTDEEQMDMNALAGEECIVYQELDVEKLMAIIPLVETFDSRLKNVENALSTGSAGDNSHFPSTSVLNAESPPSIFCENCASLEHQRQKLQTENRELRDRIAVLENKDTEKLSNSKTGARKRKKFSSVPEESDGKTEIVCKICGLSFTHEKSLKRHMTLHDELYKCSKCDRSYDRKANLDAHKKKPCKNTEMK